MASKFLWSMVSPLWTNLLLAWHIKLKIEYAKQNANQLSGKSAYTGCLKKFAIIRENSTLLFRRLVLFFSRCLTRRVINAARIVLFKSTIKLDNFSSEKKHNLQLAG